MEARTRAARAAYKGLLWGMRVLVFLLSFPTSLGSTPKKGPQRRKEGNFQMPSPQEDRGGLRPGDLVKDGEGWGRVWDRNGLGCWPRAKGKCVHLRLREGRQGSGRGDVNSGIRKTQ